METINPWGVAKFDPRGMNGTIYVEDHQPLLHTKYQSCWPSGFREEAFLAHLSRRLTGELIVYPCSGVRRPSSVVVRRRPSSSVVHNFKDLLL